jgi:hypothetical protein
LTVVVEVFDASGQFDKPVGYFTAEQTAFFAQSPNFFHAIARGP